MLVESLTAHRPTSLRPDEQAGQQLKGEDEVPPPSSAPQQPDSESLYVRTGVKR